MHIIGKGVTCRPQICQQNLWGVYRYRDNQFYMVPPQNFGLLISQKIQEVQVGFFVCILSVTRATCMYSNPRIPAVTPVLGINPPLSLDSVQPSYAKYPGGTAVCTSGRGHLIECSICWW